PSALVGASALIGATASGLGAPEISGHGNVSTMGFIGTEQPPRLKLVSFTWQGSQGPHGVGMKSLPVKRTVDNGGLLQAKCPKGCCGASCLPCCGGACGPCGGSGGGSCCGNCCCGPPPCGAISYQLTSGPCGPVVPCMKCFGCCQCNCCPPFYFVPNKCACCWEWGCFGPFY
ncbi:CG34167, partial [Drosophila busckii]